MVTPENAVKIKRGRRTIDVSGIYFLQPDGEKFWVQKHVGTITGKDFDPAKAWRAGSGTLPWEEPPTETPGRKGTVQ